MRKKLIRNFEFYDNYPTQPDPQAIKEQIPTSRDTPGFLLAEKHQDKRRYQPYNPEATEVPIFDAKDPTSFVKVLLHQTKVAENGPSKENGEKEANEKEKNEKGEESEGTKTKYEPAPYDETLVSNFFLFLFLFCFFLIY